MRVYYIIIHLVLLFTLNTVFGQIVETITSKFNASGGISVDDSGYVYVADFGFFLNNANGTKVYKLTKNGDVEQFADGIQGASGNAFDSQGNLYQSNIAGNILSKITPDGTVSTFARVGIAGPVGVAVDKNDTIYVANCGGNSIAKVHPDGTSRVWVEDNLLQCPNGLTIDDDGNLYACNFNNGRVIKVTPQKEVSILAEIPGGRCGHLTYFEGMLYVVARCAHQIYSVTLEGEVNLIAGNGSQGNVDGDLLAASFNHPNGIEAVREGNQIILYVNDATSIINDCLNVALNPVVVRKITLDVVSDIEDQDLIENKFVLHQNYPNPFNPSTKIKYTIPKNEKGTNANTFVRLNVFNTLGKHVQTVVNDFKRPGFYEINFDASELSAGIYYYQLTTNNVNITKKMTLLK